MTTDAGMEEREKLFYADKTDMEVARHINLSLLMCQGVSDVDAGFDTVTSLNDVGLERVAYAIGEVRRAALRSTPPTTAALSGREDGSRESSLLSGSVTVNDPLDLLPCPFCGGEARITEGGNRYYVACLGSECFCCVGEGYDASAMPDHMFFDEELATDAWNKRTALPHDHRPIDPVDRASVVEECIAAAKSVGNFGDYKREELTDDYGKPRFDMMNEIIDRLRSLSTQQDKRAPLVREKE